MRPRAAEKLTNGVENRGVGTAFVAYLQLNVSFARFFGVVKAHLAVVLRHFCVHFAAIDANLRGDGEWRGMLPECRVPTPFQYAPTMGNSTQLQRGAGRG
jgi:hypothetical protein